MGIFDRLFRKNRPVNAIDKGTSSAIEGDFDAWRSDPGQLHREAPFDSYASPSHSVIALDCFQLWFSNPLARRFVEITVDFIIGDGFEISSKNPAVNAYINQWATDPTVDIFVLADQWANDLLILGEYGLQPEVNEISGFVRYEPLDVTSVVEVYSRYGKPQLVKSGSAFSSALKTIAYKDIDPSSHTYGALKGDLIFAQINTTTLLSRGYSILLTLRDWIRANDDFIYNELSRAVALRKFLIHLKVTGATQQKLKEYEEKYKEPPTSGTMIVSNEKEEWSFLSPNLNAGDTTTLSKTIRNLILAGAGTAEHWLAEGGDVNRATAAEMSKPILRRLVRYQSIYMRFVTQVCTFARDQAIIARAIPGVTLQTDDIDIEVIPDPVQVEDQATQWDFFQKMVSTLATAVTSELMTDGEARSAVEKFLNEMGIDAEQLDTMADEKLKALYKKHGLLFRDFANNKEATLKNLKQTGSQDDG